MLLAAATGCTDTPPVPQQPEQSTAAGDTSAAIAAADSAGAALALEGDGLRVFLLPTGSARPLPFGSALADIVTILTRVMGTPLERGDNADCAVHFVKWPRGLTTWFARDRFSGWHLTGDSELTTASGVGIGTTRTELLAVYAAEIKPSSLGQEFSAGGLAGLLDSSGPDARISHLWAGATCIAR